MVVPARMPDIFAPDWQARPYWWDDAAPQPADGDLPARVDVAIVGAGYCGIMAGMALAENGVGALVLDAQDPGWGAATRNHGHVGGVGRIPAQLEKQVGPERAAAIREDAVLGWDWLQALIRDRGLDVDFALRGRFMGAHSPAAYRMLLDRAVEQRASLGMTIHAIPREAQRTEIGSDFYFGGTVTEQAGSLHPGKLYQEMRRLAEAAGAEIRGKAAVQAITRIPGGFRLQTTRGTVLADQVVVATNAYTDGLSAEISRGLVPVTAWMMATEEMPAGMAAAMMPTNRSGGDTKRAIYAYRLAPGGRRIIFAARADWRGGAEHGAAPTLHAQACNVWPELRGVRLSHTWKGMIAFTFDHVPHMGSTEGLHFVAGCNGSGVVRMSYLGRQIGLKIAGKQNRPCGFDGLAAPSLPFYRGRPWFLPMLGRYYALRDHLDRTLALRH